MKHKIFEFKNLKIDTYIMKVHNGFEFTPIEMCKYEISRHKYLTIKISLFKIIINIDFIWNGLR